MSDVVERYRLYAAECVRLAQDVSVLKQKLTLLDMAQHWLALAEQALKNAGTIWVARPMDRDAGRLRERNSHCVAEYRHNAEECR